MTGSQFSLYIRAPETKQYHFAFSIRKAKMVRKPRKPSFFKVLIGDFIEKLRIPPAFVKYFNGDVPRTTTLKSGQGKLWRVTMEQNSEGYFLRRGWSEFVKDHRLETGDFLVFRFLGNSKFMVVIYTRTGCEKNMGVAANNIIHEQCIITGENNETPSTARGVSGAIIKRARHVDLGKKIKIEQERVAEAVDSIKPMQPYFALSFKEYKKFNIVVPRKFVDETRLASKRRAMLKDPAGRMWPINVCVWKSGQVSLSSGWSSFCAANGITEGDMCVFQFVKGTGNENEIDVQILKREG